METLKIILDWGCPVLLVIVATLCIWLSKKLEKARKEKAEVIKECYHRKDLIFSIISAFDKFAKDFNSWHSHKINAVIDIENEIYEFTYDEIIVYEEETENEEEDEEPTDSDTAQDA